MVRFSKIVLIFFISLFYTNISLGKSPPPGTGTANIPANIMIMLDNSGSMSSQLYSSLGIYTPIDVATDSQKNIYVLEYAYNRISVFDQSGKLLRRFGSYGSACNQWQYARQIDIYDDILYVADYYGKSIKVLSLTGSCYQVKYPVAGGEVAGGGPLWPMGITANSYGVCITTPRGDRTYDYDRITCYRKFSNPRQELAWGGGNSHRVGDSQNRIGRYSWGLDYDDNSNRLLIASKWRKCRYGACSWKSGILRMADYKNPKPGLSWNPGLFGGREDIIYSDGYFDYVTDVRWTDDGNYVFAVDHRYHRLQKFDKDGRFICKVGRPSSTAPFSSPYGLGIDTDDNVYVADYGNHSVRKFDDNCNLLESFGGALGSRLDAAKKVIKKIVSDTNLTSGANFGLTEWSTTRSSDTRVRIKISDNGAKNIFSDVNNVKATGYTTDLSHALNLVKNHFLSGQVPNWNQTCSQNYLIVISDGYWSNHNSVLSLADQLNKSYGIKTFAVGFALNGSNNNYKTLAEKGGTNTPLYATNEAELLSKLTDAIKQVITGRLTFSTPAVMSEITKGNFVYQATFEYEKNIQWKGNLKKYKLNSDGTFGAEQWDAANKLNNKNASSRNIWTSGLSTESINNFTVSNKEELKSLLFPNQSPTDNQVENLINFIRGTDTYDQDADGSTNDSIHKLADIYNSNLFIVGPPDASSSDTGNSNYIFTDNFYRSNNNYSNFVNGNSCGGSCNVRTEVVLAGANNGILHAFKTLDGEELWGFIPPIIHENFEQIPSSKSNSTNAIYGVDSTPVVKDIFFDDTISDNNNNPRWRTILISGLGAGGKGFFALDISDINNPKQIFAIQNDTSNKLIKHWDENGVLNQFGYSGGNINPEFDYRELGETWSVPRIIRIKINGVDRWVAVFGGGYNGSTNPDYGSAVFVVDLENEGRLIKKIDIQDKSSRILKAIVWGTPTPNSQKEWNLGPLGLSSYDSNYYKLKLSGSAGINYSYSYNENNGIRTNIKINFDEAPPSNNIFKIEVVNKDEIINSVPADLSVITADGTPKANYNGAIVYATDLEGKVTKINLTDKGTLYQTTTLFDAESTSSNGRYIFTRPEITINNDNNLWLYFGTGNTQKLQEQSNQIQNRVYGIKDENFPNFVTISNPGTIANCKTAPNCPGGSDLGWYVNLPNKQKLTAEPTVDKDRVYFPIYEPTSGTNACKTGKAILRAFDSKCGNSLLNVNLGTGVLSKVVKQGDNLYIGLAGEADKNISGFTSTDNLLTGKSQAKDIGGEAQLEKWKENY
jgi:type IV pilus assembly protein PilY1